MNQQAIGREGIELRLRSVLLAILVFGMVGTVVELLLLEHTETLVQIVPILCLLSGIVAACGAAIARTPGAVRILQVVMAAFLVAGAVGVAMHYKGNTEFELETYPSRHGFELFKESMMGATPALAPGTMALLGMLGLAYTYRHPLLRESGSITGGAT